MKFALRIALFAVFTLTSTLVSLVSLAQPPSMALDIRTEPLVMPPWVTGPYLFARLGGFLYFSADDGIHGIELWRTDGTSGGTAMVADVCPGQCSGLYTWRGTAAGDLVFFVADDGVHGLELWASDGTSQGTRMVRDISSQRNSYPQWLTALGDRLAFTAQEDEHGRELWISDGTEAGTVLLEDLNPGASGSEPSALLVTDGLVFFNAFEPSTGRELWASDGTPGAAVRLGDLRPGSANSTYYEQSFPTNPRYAAVTDGRYYFVGDDDTVAGAQLFVTDGNPGGITRLTSIDTPSHGGILDVTVVGSAVYFVARDPTAGAEIWRSDGSPGGTRRVTDVQPGFDYMAPRGLTAVGNRLFFTDHTDATGTELWVTDGTTAGTELVADINPGSGDSLDWSFAWTGGWPLDADRLLFFADDGVHGIEPWVSDGTSAGTILLGDLSAGDLPSHFAVFGPYSPPEALAGGMTFFAWNRDIGFEPWWTDGSPAGTRMIADIDQQASSQGESFWFPFADLAMVGNQLFFQAQDDDHGLELWVSGGTPGTTRLVKDVETGTEGGEPLGSSPFELAPLEDKLIYQARLPHPEPNGNINAQAWRSDGTAAGTFPLVGEGDNYGFSAAGGAAFFQGEDGFWATDGTLAGTKLITDIDSGGRASEFAGKVFLPGHAATTGIELYQLDATLTKASLVADLIPGPDSSAPASLATAGALLFFSAVSPDTGRELWVSDGSEEGTGLVADIHPGAEGSMKAFPSTLSHGFDESLPIVGSGPLAFIVANDGDHGEEVWVSDGTTGGTHLLADIQPGSNGSHPLWLTDVGDKLYFRAVDGTTGAELWTSDGTTAGTYRVADLAPGEASSDPRFLVNVDGVLHFTAWTPTGGAELWRLDGTGNPEQVSDIVPGPGSSSPSYLTVAGRRLFFFATDGVHGYEPWSMVLPSRKLHASLSSTRDGDHVILNIVLTNPTPVDQPDATGDELVLPLPAGLTPVSAEATGGTVELVVGGGLGQANVAPTTSHTLLWNGPLPAGGTETITVELSLATGLATSVQLQAELSFDTDADGVNDLSVPSDDPTLPGASDPTVIEAVETIGVPALGTPGAVLLMALLLVGALWRLRVW